MSERTVRVQAMLTEDEADEIRREAAERSVEEKRRFSMSDVIRELVIAHIERRKEKRKRK